MCDDVVVCFVATESNRIAGNLTERRYELLECLTKNKQTTNDVLLSLAHLLRAHRSRIRPIRLPPVPALPARTDRAHGVARLPSLVVEIALDEDAMPLLAKNAVCLSVVVHSIFIVSLS